MVVPGSSGVTQTPLATSFQPGGVETAPAEREPREEQTQPSLAPAAESQNSEQQTFQSREAEDSASVEPSESGETRERGSVLDIEV